MPEPTLSYEQYLEGLPAERRVEIERVWGLVREHLPAGYTEEVGGKFLSFKAGADWYVALANQKNYISLYLMPLYVFPEMKAKFDAAASKKLKCGKSCINFQRAEELPLETLAEIVSSYEAEAFVAQVQKIRADAKASGKKATASN